MAKRKFRYNPQTLSFEPIKVPVLKKFTNLTIQFGLSLIVAAIVFFSYTYFFDTPKEKILKRDNTETLVKFEFLARQVEESNKLLSEIQSRDNKIYRAIFDADTISTSLRTGGIGGATHYGEFDNFNYSELLIDIATKLDQVTWKTYIQSKSFDEVIGLAKNKEKMIVSVPAIQPISVKDFGRISGYFGNRTDPFTRQKRFHHGVDFTGSIGSPIYATGNGTVISAEYSFFGYGNVVLVDHGFGYKTRYAHLNSLAVKSGDTLTRGQIVGTLGNSGRSTGPHLHYEVIYRNRVVDPLNYFNDMTTEEYERMVNKSTPTPMD
ncbi:MAG: M23 family metallopeptidase [Bacteroidales bacterium]|nr:M23 family metallopeptidase [Bacteroidales bacterium]